MTKNPKYIINLKVIIIFWFNNPIENTFGFLMSVVLTFTHCVKHEIWVKSQKTCRDNLLTGADVGGTEG